MSRLHPRPQTHEGRGTLDGASPLVRCTGSWPTRCAPLSAAQGSVSGLAEDPVQLGAALRAHGLGHATTVGDDDVALGLPLLAALDAVELSGIGLVSHIRSSLFFGDVPPRPARHCPAAGTDPL